MILTLTEMKLGQVGIVCDVKGGLGATERIRSMGIRIGKKIKKTGSNFGRGPQTVLIDNYKVAIGYGMATKIMVEVENDENK